MYLWTVRRRRSSRRKTDFVAVVRDKDYGGLRPSQPDIEQLKREMLSQRDAACLERAGSGPWFTPGADGHCYLNPVNSRGRRLNPYYFYRFEHVESKAA